MKPIFRYAIFLLPILLLCTSCDNSRSLGNGYMLEDSDRSHVYIIRLRNGNSQIVVDQQIVAWQSVGQYVLVLRKVALSPDCLLKNGQTAIITHYTSAEEYWMINLKSDEIIGPISKSEFKLRIKKLGLHDVDLATPASYQDNSKEFQNAAVKCNEHT